MRSKAIYDEVTANLIREMERGVAPWVMPWTREATTMLPRNGLTRRTYSGMNVLILWNEAVVRGFGSSRWVSFRQARMMGGHVRKGERGVKILFCGRRRLRPSVEEDDESLVREVPVLRLYTVFNLDQVGGVEPDGGSLDVEPRDAATIPALVAAAGATLVNRGGEACYLPGKDVIRMPPRKAFADRANYDATLAHEAIHWTGHPTRLDRGLDNRFGDPAYAREELVAEIGSAFLCAETGVEGKLQHAAYLDHWVQQLKEEPRLLVRAASKAQEAVGYLRRLAGLSAAFQAA